MPPDAEIHRAIAQLAELSLLGGGDRDLIYPNTLDQMYSAAGEGPARVVLGM